MCAGWWAGWGARLAGQWLHCPCPCALRCAARLANPPALPARPPRLRVQETKTELIKTLQALTEGKVGERGL